VFICVYLWLIYQKARKKDTIIIMQLVLNTRGSFLKKNKNCFLVKTYEKSFEVPADKVDSII